MRNVIVINKKMKTLKTIAACLLAILASIGFIALLSEGADGGITLVNFAGLAVLILSYKGLEFIDNKQFNNK